MSLEDIAIPVSTVVVSGSPSTREVDITFYVSRMQQDKPRQIRRHVLFIHQ